MYRDRDPGAVSAASSLAQRPLRLIQPSPAKLSAMSAELAEIEKSGIYGNYGPLNQRLEAAFIEQLFGGTGSCVTCCNATIGLLLAIKQATMRQRPARRYAVMPSFTFAAAAQAALWNGLTPLLCDIDPVTWLPCADSMRDLVARHADEIAVVIPCATLGFPEELERYRELVRPIGAALVVDAAAAIGTAQEGGLQFGAGCREAIVFSLHATKAFATFEGGLIYADDPDAIAQLRMMGNFGFATGRLAMAPGLNAKLDEITALAGLSQLARLPAIVGRREALADAYRDRLPGLATQPRCEGARAHVFMSVLLPSGFGPRRAEIVDRMAAGSIQVGTYYDPHLARQPFFAETCLAGDLTVTDDVAGRILSLPLHEGVEEADVDRVASALLAAMAGLDGP